MPNNHSIIKESSAHNPLFLREIANTCLLPIINRCCGLDTGAILRRLRQSERFSRTDLECLQASKLAHLLHEATLDVPFYRHLRLAAPASCSSARETLSKMSILTKDHIRNAGIRLRNPNFRRVHKSATGGTTGIPLHIWRDYHNTSIGVAALWRGNAWAGIHPWDKAISIKGFQPISLIGRLRMRAVRKWVVEAFQPSSTKHDHILSLINSVRPALIEGYVTDLLNIASSGNLSRAGIRAVMTTGEMLFPAQKRLLEIAFAAPVYSYYGSNEISALAFECENGSKHITDEHAIIETVDDQDNVVWEKPGRILVTDLDNHAMPLIRYEIGDIGVLSQGICKCGRELLVLKELHGRQQDALFNKNGDSLSATFFAGRFRDLRFVGNLQIIQHDINAIEILHEINSREALAELRLITNEISSRLGSDTKVWTTHTNPLPGTARGKRRMIVSKLPSLKSSTGVQ